MSEAPLEQVRSRHMTERVMHCPRFLFLSPSKPDFFIMSPNFAEFLLDTTNNGNEILAVLEDIVEVVETGGTDL